MFTEVLKIAMLSMAINIIFVPVNQAVAVLAGYTTIIATLCLPFIELKKPVCIRVKLGGICLLGIGVIMLCSALMHTGYTNINVDFIKTILSFFCCYMAIMIDKHVIQKRDLQQIFFINKCLSCILVAYTYLPFSFRYTTVNEWNGQQFTMGMGNPNATSINVMFCVVLLVLEITWQSNRTQKGFCIGLLGALAGTLIQLQSRTVIVCCGLILLAGIFKQIRLRKGIVAVVVLFPLVMAFIQIWLGTINTNIQFIGKAITTGRDKMFTELLRTIENTPSDFILGKVLTYRLENSHNAPLALILNIGILGYILFVIMWNFEFQDILSTKHMTRLQYIACLALLAYMIHSSSEASPMLGVIPYATQIVLLSRLAKDTVFV